jgi:hypothetical protein
MRITQLEADFVVSLSDVDGNINDKAVTNASRAPDAPTHHRYNWNVEEAAEQQWDSISRALIAAVRVEVVVSRRTIAAPYFVRDPEAPPTAPRYRTLTRIDQIEVAREVVSMELQRCENAIMRCQKVATVLALEKKLIVFLQEIADLKAEAAIATPRQTRGPRPRTETRRTKQPRSRRRAS